MSRLPLLLVVAAACHRGPTAVPTAANPTTGRASEHPRLVVLLVIDQWPEWAFEQKRAALIGGGFDRLLAEGAWHVGEHPSAATLTAPGHALLGSGQPTSGSGILGNEWYHRDLDRRLHADEAEDGTMSAKWMRVAGLGDSIAHAKSGAKAVAVSLKDRASILPLGHAGLPLWYDKTAVAFTSLAPPGWLATYAAAHPIGARIHEIWEPLDAAALPTLSGTIDAAPGEVGDKHLGATFPHSPDASGDPADAVFATPLGNDLVLETALAAVDGEHLGTDAAPDLLVVSLSAHDYIGHGWGHESWEMWDATLRLDRQLATFLTGLDQRVGAGQWAMIVTSDHGASPLPERVGGGHITFEEIKSSANRAAIAELGPGEWIADVKYPTVFLAKAALAQPPKDRDIAIKKIMLALRAFPGIARVEKTADFAGNCETRKGDARVICDALDAERSGEIVYLPAPGWILHEGTEPTATAHGSAQLYDRLVPVIELAPGRAGHAPLAAPDATRVPMTAIAPLLAKWLGVAAPSTIQVGL